MGFSKFTRGFAQTHKTLPYLKVQYSSVLRTMLTHVEWKSSPRRWGCVWEKALFSWTAVKLPYISVSPAGGQTFLQRLYRKWKHTPMVTIELTPPTNGVTWLDHLCVFFLWDQWVFNWNLLVWFQLVRGIGCVKGDVWKSVGYWV